MLVACGGGGSGGAPATSAAQLSPAALSFADTPLGVQSPTQAIEIINPGSSTLMIDGVAVSGADAASFRLANGCAASLPPAGSCTVSIAFAPSAAGALSASVIVRSGIASSNAVALSGNGIAPTVSLSAPSANFPTMAVGTASTPQTISVTNTGAGALTIGDITLTGSGAGDFTQRNTCAAPLAPAASCSVTIAFAPTSIGTALASLVLQSNAVTTPAVSLSGVAVVAGSPTLVLKALLANPPAITPYVAASAGLTTDLSASATNIAITSPAGFPAAGNFIARLSDNANTEYVLVTAGAGTPNWVVIRGYNGSAAADFAAAGTSVTYIPLAAQKSATINGTPLTLVAATFTASVGGQAVGTLANPIQNGLYPFTFADGEVRNVTVQNNTMVSWSPALGAGTIMSASVTPTLAPAGVASNAPAEILTQRFDLGAPVYLTQHQRLTRRGALLTGDLAASGAATISVDTTSGFPQNGNFMISTGAEDVLVNVADATTLDVIARAQDGTIATALSASAGTFYQLFEVDFGDGGTQAFYAPGALNSGLHYLGVAGTVGPLKEYQPKQPLSVHFVLNGSYFEVLASGNVSMFAIADGVVQQSANYLVEPSYGGAYWHKFDFGSSRTRHITLFASAYPMSIATSPTDTIAPWDRSQEPFISWDGDSFGQVEGYSWSSAPDGGGLGFYFEMMLDLGITQFDYTGAVGGTGYSQQGGASPPLYPRPKYSGVNRVAAVAAGPAPTLFFCGLGHNDNSIVRAQFAQDTATYWRALRAAWPDTVFVAAQYFFPAAGAAAPLAFQPNPLSTPNDPSILAALTAVGGPWVYVNSNQGTWTNSSGASGTFATPAQPLLTGTGYGGAPGYLGGHSTGVGNGDLMIRDDGIHPSNLGARYLGQKTAAAISAAVAAL